MIGLSLLIGWLGWAASHQELVEMRGVAMSLVDAPAASLQGDGDGDSTGGDGGSGSGGSSGRGGDAGESAHAGSDSMALTRV